MPDTIPLDGPADLATLDEFLASDEAPPDCMQLSELDGFLAGIVAGPTPIPFSVWLPMVWRAETAFADIDQANAVLGIILRRYNDIIRQLDAGPGVYRVVLVEQEDGSFDASDWTLGFLQAMSLCQDDWLPLVMDPMADTLIQPIMLIASTTEKANLPLDEYERLSEAEMAKLLANAGPMLGLCVTAIRLFFRTRNDSAKRKRPARAAARRRR